MSTCRDGETLCQWIRQWEHARGWACSYIQHACALETRAGLLLSHPKHVMLHFMTPCEPIRGGTRMRPNGEMHQSHWGHAGFVPPAETLNGASISIPLTISQHWSQIMPLTWIPTKFSCLQVLRSHSAFAWKHRHRSYQNGIKLNLVVIKTGWPIRQSETTNPCSSLVCVIGSTLVIFLIYHSFYHGYFAIQGCSTLPIIKMYLQ